ncbi:MAG: aconitase X catalytic domain-containing protein [Acidobacteria bacterium]|nr:aconitase X catalytic domain-containing protein [Acidobacteriota bacterium]
MPLRLDADERAWLDGAAGPARRLAMRLIVHAARNARAERLRPITRAHVDGCLYHGPVSVDFARTLADAGARVVVPTTLNVSAIDHLHPDLFRGAARIADGARALRRAYAAMGCRQTWTCAPYQLPDRPAFGEQIAWAESNAIVFANSVLGARTERYGDFIDIAAAITGRVPDAGLHRDEGRHARVLVQVRGVSATERTRDLFFAALGHQVGLAVGGAIPVIEGVDHAAEDDLKALGAAAASSGAVAMFHVAGVTPEAPTVAAALGGRPPERVVRMGPADLAAALRALGGDTDAPLGAVCLGTPHFSVAEFRRLRAALAGRPIDSSVRLYVSTGRDVLAAVAAEGWADDLRAAGVTLVTDTCTYLTPILEPRPGAVMTNSAKWAWYAPGNLGCQVVFASLEACVESAVRGRVCHDPAMRELTGA